MAYNSLSLAERMRALADGGHPRAEELRAKAADFDRKTAHHYSPAGGSESAKAMLGAWARARKLWCECTGEPLV